MNLIMRGEVKLIINKLWHYLPWILINQIMVMLDLFKETVKWLLIIFQELQLPPQNSKLNYMTQSINHFNLQLSIIDSEVTCLRDLNFSIRSTLLVSQQRPPNKQIKRESINRIKELVWWSLTSKMRLSVPQNLY